MKELNERELWERAGELLDTSNPFDYNQAMMDLGSMVCTKTKPRCNECPAVDICQGKNAPELYPTPKKSKLVKVHRKVIGVLRNDSNEYYATPRSSRFLNGLFHFMEREEGVTSFSLESINYAIDKKMFLGAIRQQYSHFTLEADAYLVKAGKTKGIHWYNSDALSRLPMSMAEHKILGLLEIPLKKGLTG
jgi:A/G-specific adenine glycosylase